MKPSLPLLFFGAVAIVAGLSPTLFTINTRIYQRKGMTTGGAAWRRGESPHDYQERSKALDKTWAQKAEHLRPYGLVLTLAGAVLVAVGLAI